MARVANTYSSTWNSTNQSAHTANYRLRRYITSTEGDISCVHEIRTNIFSPPTTGYDSVSHLFGTTTDWENHNIDLACDTTHYYRCKALFYSMGSGTFTVFGNTKSFLSYAVDPTVGTPSLSGEASSSVTVGGNWTPATVETTVTATVQYKKTADGTWSTWGSTSDSDTGYVSVPIDSTVITGLDAETSYDFRLLVTRTNTANDTKTYTGSTATTSTIADTPSVTTDAANGVGTTVATLNGTVDHNTVDGALSWRYILTASYSAPPDDVQGTEVTYASNPITEDGSGSYQISSLAASTGYTFWAIYDPTGAESTVLGSALTFTTAAASTPADEEMLPIQDFDRKWGVATTIFFVAPQDSVSSSNLFYAGASVWATTETKITAVVYDDDKTPTITAEADATNAPVLVGNNLFRLDLEAA